MPRIRKETKWRVEILDEFKSCLWVAMWKSRLMGISDKYYLRKKSINYKKWKKCHKKVQNSARLKIEPETMMVYWIKYDDLLNEIWLNMIKLLNYYLKILSSECVVDWMWLVNFSSFLLHLIHNLWKANPSAILRPFLSNHKLIYLPYHFEVFVKHFTFVH